MAFLDVSDPVTLVKYFFYVDGRYDYNMPAWFFVSLFFIYLFAYFLNLSKRSPLVRFLIAIGAFLLGYLFYIEMPTFTEWGITLDTFGFVKTIISLGFFAFGSFFISVFKKLPKAIHSQFIFNLFFPSLIIWLIFGICLNPKVSFYLLNISNYWYFILSGLFGSLTFIVLSYLISKIKYVRFIFIKWGENTIFITGTHLVDTIGPASFFVASHSSLYGTELFNIVCIGFAVILITTYTVACLVIDRYLPYLSGKDPYFYRALHEKYLKRKEANNIAQK